MTLFGPITFPIPSWCATRYATDAGIVRLTRDVPVHFQQSPENFRLLQLDYPVGMNQPPGPDPCPPVQC